MRRTAHATTRRLTRTVTRALTIGIAATLTCGAVAPSWAAPAAENEAAVQQSTPTMFPGSKTIPAARAGEPFEYRITYAGRTDAVTAKGLPAGLSMDASGLITGVPHVKSGTYTFTLSAFDKIMLMTKTETTSMRVEPVIPDGTTPAIDGTPTNAYYGYAYNYRFTLTGRGTAVRVSSGSLPPGLSLSTDGLVTGNLTSGTAKTYTFGVVAENDFESSPAREFSITIPVRKNYGALGSSENEYDFTFKGFETIAWNTYKCPDATPYLIDHEFVGGIWPRGALLAQQGVRIGYSATKLWRDDRQSGVENLHMNNTVASPAKATLVLHCTNDLNAAAG